MGKCIAFQGQGRLHPQTGRSRAPGKGATSAGPAPDEEEAPAGAIREGQKQNSYNEGYDMSDLTLRQNLSHAWLQRAESAANDLEHATTAPALFKPEFVAQRQTDYSVAMRWANYWQRQAVSA